MTRYTDFACFFRRLTASTCAIALISTYGAPAIAQGEPPAAPSQPGPQAPKKDPETAPPAKAAPPKAESAPGEAAAAPAKPKGAETSEAEPAAEPDEATKKKAAEALAAADEAYAAKDYETAHAKYVESNTLVPSPEAQYGVGMSLAKLERPTEAYLVLSELMSSEGRDALGEEKLATAQGELDALEKMPGTLRLTIVPDTATVSVDGAERPMPPAGVQGPRQLELAPGKHAVIIEAPGFEPTALEIDIKPGEQVAQNVELQEKPEAAPAAPVAPAKPAEPAAEPAAEPEPEAQERSRVPAYVTLGVAGASAIVGTIFGIKALSAKSDYDDNPTTARADDVERNALIADMALGVTITLGVTGVVLLTSDEPSEAAAKAPPKLERARVQISPYVSPKGDAGGASARVTF